MINQIVYYNSPQKTSSASQKEKNYFCSLYQHTALGECIILTKERNGQYHLLGGTGKVESQIKELGNKIKITPNTKEHLCSYRINQKLINVFTGQLQGKTEKLNARYRLPLIQQHKNRQTYFPKTADAEKKKKGSSSFGNMVQDVMQIHRDFGSYHGNEQTTVKNLLKDSPETTGIAFYPLSSGQNPKGVAYHKIRKSLKTNMTKTARAAVDYLIRNRGKQPRTTNKTLEIKQDGSTTKVMNRFASELSELFNKETGKKMKK